MLTSDKKSSYNDSVITKKVVIGRRKPERYSRRTQHRHSSTRLSGFFMRSYHFLTSEACRQLRAGRYLENGISYPAAPYSPAVGSGRKAPIICSRSLAMQEVSAFEPTYEIGFVLQHLQSHTLNPEMATMSAKNFRTIAR